MEKESLRIRPFSRKEFKMTQTKGYSVVKAHSVSTIYVHTFAGVTFFTIETPP